MGLLDNLETIYEKLYTDSTGNIKSAITTKGGTVTSNSLANLITGVGSIPAGGMPEIPADSAFTTATLGTTYTCSTSSWLKYELRSTDYGGPSESTLNVGTRSYTLSIGPMDDNYASTEGVAPVYAGERFYLTPAAVTGCYLKYETGKVSE